MQGSALYKRPYIRPPFPYQVCNAWRAKLENSLCKCLLLCGFPEENFGRGHLLVNRYICDCGLNRAEKLPSRVASPADGWIFERMGNLSLGMKIMFTLKLFRSSLDKMMMKLWTQRAAAREQNRKLQKDKEFIFSFFHLVQKGKVPQPS